MNKKLVIIIVASAIITGFICIISFKPNTKEKNSKTRESSNIEKNQKSSGDEIDNKIAVIYFSASGTTKSAAQIISNQTNGQLIEIIPKEKYTKEDLNWNDSKSRTSIECNDSKTRPEIEGEIDVDNYDIIYLGYPIWWGDVPHIILTFMDTYKLDGKTIIPFCTSGGTSINQSQDTLKNYNKKVKWIDGKRLTTSENEIKNWLSSLKY